MYMCRWLEIVTEGNDFLLCFQAEVEVVEQYSDPRDSKNKAYVEPGAETSLPTIYSKVNRNYCRPYTGKWCITFVLYLWLRCDRSLPPCQCVSRRKRLLKDLA